MGILYSDRVILKSKIIWPIYILHICPEWTQFFIMAPMANIICPPHLTSSIPSPSFLLFLLLHPHWLPCFSLTRQACSQLSLCTSCSLSGILFLRHPQDYLLHLLQISAQRSLSQQCLSYPSYLTRWLSPLLISLTLFLYNIYCLLTSYTNCDVWCLLSISHLDCKSPEGRMLFFFLSLLILSVWRNARHVVGRQ